MSWVVCDTQSFNLFLHLIEDGNQITILQSLAIKFYTLQINSIGMRGESKRESEVNLNFMGFQKNTDF